MRRSAALQTAVQHLGVFKAVAVQHLARAAAGDFRQQLSPDEFADEVLAHLLIHLLQMRGHDFIQVLADQAHVLGIIARKIATGGAEIQPLQKFGVNFLLQGHDPLAHGDLPLVAAARAALAGHQVQAELTDANFIAHIHFRPLVQGQRPIRDDGAIESQALHEIVAILADDAGVVATYERALETDVAGGVAADLNAIIRRLNDLALVGIWVVDPDLHASILMLCLSCRGKNCSCATGAYRHGRTNRPGDFITHGLSDRAALVGVRAIVRIFQ